MPVNARLEGSQVSGVTWPAVEISRTLDHGAARGDLDRLAVLLDELFPRARDRAR